MNLKKRCHEEAAIAAFKDLLMDTLSELSYANYSFNIIFISLLFLRYWPEFGTNGKENITLGNLLSHQAGLAAFESKISEEDVKVG